MMLRTCPADGRTHDGFKWPLEVGSRVCCPDPDPDPNRDCGGGLHGLPWGEGDGDLLSWAENAVWVVFEPEKDDEVVFSAGKARCWGTVTVRHVGARHSATCFVAEHGGAGKAIVGGTATAGDSGTATAGYSGTATAGDRGTATAGYSGTLCLRWWDGAANRYRMQVAYVGENGIKANTSYRLGDRHQFVGVETVTATEVEGSK